MPDVLDIQPTYLHPHNAAMSALSCTMAPSRCGTTRAWLGGTGTLALRWLPSTGLRLDVDVIVCNAPQPGSPLQIEASGGVAEALAQSHQHGFKDGASFEKVGAFLSAIELGAGNQLASVGFQIVNFPTF